MFKPVALLAVALVALGAATPAHAHDRGHSRVDRLYVDHDDRRYLTDRRHLRRGELRAHRRALRRNARAHRWHYEHRRFLNDRRAFRHRHDRAGWHWHRGRTLTPLYCY
ncbi:MAG: hypothetical protein AAFU66_07720 [Pseudomonadota bacterium]